VNEDPRITRAIRLLRQSWELLTEAYSRLVLNLEASLSIALRTVVVDLNNRGDWNILPEVLPSTKDFTDEEWLKWLGDQLGPEPPTS